MKTFTRQVSFMKGCTVANLRCGRDPPHPIFFRFHTVFGKSMPNNRLAPLEWNLQPEVEFQFATRVSSEATMDFCSGSGQPKKANAKTAIGGGFSGWPLPERKSAVASDETQVMNSNSAWAVLETFWIRHCLMFINCTTQGRVRRGPALHHHQGRAAGTRDQLQRDAPQNRRVPGVHRQPQVRTQRSHVQSVLRIRRQ